MKLENFLPYQLSVLSNKISKEISKYYRDQHGIKIPEWRVLVLLSDTANQTAKELCIRSEMDKVKISRAVNSLEKKNLILEKQNKSDGRSRKYRLSKKGERLFNLVQPHALEFEKRLIESIPENEYDQFQNMMKYLYQRAEKLNKEIY